MDEQWVDVKGYEGFYQVSDMGRVRSVDRYVTYSNGDNHFRKGRVLAKCKSGHCNYLVVNLCRSSGRRLVMVHRLVAEGFLGLDLQSDMEVNHKNGQKFDNRVVNLEVVTRQANVDHSIAAMLKNDYGERSPHAKLTNKQAQCIREAYKRGALRKNLAKDYNVGIQVIHNVVNYKTYLR